MIYEELRDVHHSDQVPKIGAFKVIWDNGNTTYYLDGERHRTDGPASSDYRYTETGYHEWRRHGKIHRTDGPAVEYQSNSRQRPAQQYWLNNERMTYEKWLEEREIWIEKDLQESIKDQVI
jgi:hypothetical protein